MRTPGHGEPRTLRRVAGLFSPYRGRLALLGLVVVVTAGLSVGNLLLIKPVFDRGLFCPACPNLPVLFWLVGAMTTIPLLAGALGIYQPYLANTLGQRVMQHLRDTLYSHLQRMPLRFFTETKTGEIQSRLANDVGGLQRVVTETASLMLMQLVVVLSAIGAMLVLSWQLTALTLALLPPFGWLAHRVGRARRSVSSATQQALAELSALTEETLSVSGALLCRSFGRHGEQTTRFRRLSAQLAQLQLRQQMTGQGFIMGLRTIFAVMPVLAYLLAGLVLAHGGTAAHHLSVGTLTAFTALQLQLLGPSSVLIQMAVEVQASLALFERIFAYLDLPHEITDAPGAYPLPSQRVRGAISFRAVSFHYPSNEGPAPARWALQDLTLDVQPGQLAAVVGPSGSGKTTLSYLLARLYDTTTGAVLIDGHDVRTIRLDTLTATIGMVTQETHLFHASIRDNLHYGNPQATDAQLHAAARAAAIHDRILELDNGYDTLVGERGYRMSGGEKQRLAIARVILKNPKILILDEATSALDTTNEQLVHQALTPLMAGRTTLAIAHRLSTIQAADVIFVLDRGRLAERGTHTELLDQGGLYTRLHHQQLGSDTAPTRL
ncbi:MAG: ABC transporter ATP-binding protein [Pseudonocardiaceae bacterium]